MQPPHSFDLSWPPLTRWKQPAFGRIGSGQQTLTDDLPSIGPIPANKLATREACLLFRDFHDRITDRGSHGVTGPPTVQASQSSGHLQASTRHQSVLKTKPFWLGKQSCRTCMTKQSDVFGETSSNSQQTDHVTGLPNEAGYQLNNYPWESTRLALKAWSQLINLTGWDIDLL